MANQAVIVSVLADTRSFQTGMARLTRELQTVSGAANAMSRGVLKATGVAAVGLAFLAGRSIQSAAKLEQSIGAVDTIFKDASDTVNQFSKDAARSAGLSQNSYNELASRIGNSLSLAVGSTEELAGKTNDLIQVGADLASLFGGTSVQAVEALDSAFRGEFDSLQRLIPSINAAAIQKKALEMTGKANVKTLTDEEKKLATYAFIMEKTTTAQGNFLREQDTAAGRMQTFGANVENLSGNIGLLLVDAFGDVIEKLSNFTSALIEDPEFQAFIKELAAAFSDVGKFLAEDILPALGDFAKWFLDNRAWLGPLVGIVIGLAAAWQLWNVALGIFNLVTATNPVVLIILGLAALIAIIVLVIKTT